MANETQVGTGTTILFGTSAWAGEIVGVNLGGMSREAVNVSHLATALAAAGKVGSHKFIPALLTNPGELRLEVHFDSETLPPLEAVAETITITFPKRVGDSVGPKWAFTGFATAFELGVPLDNKMTGTLTVKISGEITKTDGTV